jgi:hypothetical protein
MTPSEAIESLLKQIYGMAREGCLAPAAAYRWCERIDEVMHSGRGLVEYERYAEDLPINMAATLRALAALDAALSGAPAVSGVMEEERAEALVHLVGAAAFVAGALESGVTVGPAALADLKKAIEGVIVSASPYAKEPGNG